jgi:hypothetical protein
MNYWVLGHKQHEAMDVEVYGGHEEALFVVFEATHLKESGPTKFDYVSECGTERKYWVSVPVTSDEV